MEAWHLPALFAGGLLCGIINALAGGGSFVTLPLLLWMGLPPQVANATNRVAIFLQCAAGVGTYHRGGVRPWRHLPGVAIPTALGAAVGALAASQLPEDIFRKVAAGLFVLMIGTVFVNPRRWEKPEGGGRVSPWFWPLFFLYGIYGGFLQAGLGVLLITTLVLGAGFDVVRGNALKFGLAGIFTLTALILFARAGQVRWIPGLALAAGTVTGGVIGARLVMAKGAAWVRVVVVLAALAAIVKLLAGA